MTDRTSNWLMTDVSFGVGLSLLEAAVAGGHHVVRKPEQLDAIERCRQAARRPISSISKASRQALIKLNKLGARIDVLINKAGWAASARSRIRPTAKRTRSSRPISPAIGT